MTLHDDAMKRLGRPNVPDLEQRVRELLAEVAQARAERDEWQARATRAEIAQVEARMQDISERQAESVLQAIEDRGLVTWATERDILIRRAEQAEATIATLRAELQAAQAWQPIATAPKDTTTILLTDGTYIRAGWWARRINMWSIDSVVSLPNPTHWAPIPKDSPTKAA